VEWHFDLSLVPQIYYVAPLLLSLCQKFDGVRYISKLNFDIKRKKPELWVQKDEPD